MGKELNKNKYMNNKFKIILNNKMKRNNGDTWHLPKRCMLLWRGLAFHNCMYSKHICNPEKTQVSRVFEKKKKKYLESHRVSPPPVEFTAIKGDRPAVV